MNERQEILFSGRVQGVGFRYTTHRIAGRHNVTGFVRNLADGRVAVIVEGERREIDAFVTDVQQQMQDNIEAMDFEVSEHTGDFDSFTIRR